MHHSGTDCSVHYIYCSNSGLGSSLCVSSKQIMSLSARTGKENDDVSIQDLTINTFLPCNLTLKTSYNRPITNVVMLAFYDKNQKINTQYNPSVLRLKVQYP